LGGGVPVTFVYQRLCRFGIWPLTSGFCRDSFFARRFNLLCGPNLGFLFKRAFCFPLFFFCFFPLKGFHVTLFLLVLVSLYKLGELRLFYSFVSILRPGVVDPNAFFGQTIYSRWVFLDVPHPDTYGISVGASRAVLWPLLPLFFLPSSFLLTDGLSYFRSPTVCCWRFFFFSRRLLFLIWEVFVLAGGGTPAQTFHTPHCFLHFPPLRRYDLLLHQTR